MNKPIYIPTNSVREFPFLYILSSILFADILMLDILNSVRWYLTIVLIFISLIISGVEHLFMALLATCMSSLEKCVFTFSTHFSIGFFPVFFFFFFVISLHELFLYFELTPFQLHHFQIFSLSLSTVLLLMISFVLFMDSFAVQELDEIPFAYFCFISIALGD